MQSTQTDIQSPSPRESYGTFIYSMFAVLETLQRKHTYARCLTECITLARCPHLIRIPFVLTQVCKQLPPTYLNTGTENPQILPPTISLHTIVHMYHTYLTDVTEGCHYIGLELLNLLLRRERIDVHMIFTTLQPIRIEQQECFCPQHHVSKQHMYKLWVRFNFVDIHT